MGRSEVEQLKTLFLGTTPRDEAGRALTRFRVGGYTTPAEMNRWSPSRRTPCFALSGLSLGAQHIVRNRVATIAPNEPGSCIPQRPPPDPPRPLQRNSLEQQAGVSLSPPGSSARALRTPESKGQLYPQDRTNLG